MNGGLPITAGRTIGGVEKYSTDDCPYAPGSIRVVTSLDPPGGSIYRRPRITGGRGIAPHFPLPYAVFQRSLANSARIPIAGSAAAVVARVEAEEDRVAT